MSVSYIENKDLGFSFMIHDEWTEIPKENYDKLGLKGFVVNAFIRNKDGKNNYIEVSREGSSVYSQEEFNRMLELNIKNLKKASFQISSESKINLENKIDCTRILCSVSGVNICQYFLFINQFLINFTSMLSEVYIEENDEVLQIIRTIKLEGEQA